MKVLDIYNANTTIQTFDDAKLERPVTRVFMYDPAKCKALNEQGAGIFWTINPQEKPNHRGIEDTYQFACLGMDCDVAKETDEKRGIIRPSEEEVQGLKTELFNKLAALPLPPSGILETKNGLQPYWVFTNPQKIKSNHREMANIRYQEYVRGFTKITGIKSEGDNIQRVLRMPGYYHKKSEPVFFIRDIFEVGKPCDFEDFKSTYPPVPKESPQKPIKKYEAINTSTRLEDIPVQKVLEKLSGMGIVNGEEYSFRNNSNGTIQILINGKASGQWIDPKHNTIGGSGEGKGNPTVIQWLAWYYKQKGDSNEVAHSKAYHILYPLFLPHMPPDLWNRNMTKGNNNNSPKKSLSEIILPEINPDKIAKALVNKDFMNGIQTGYKFFDLTTGGLKRQFSYLVAARSKNLKSMFSLNLLFRVAQKNIPVAYFDLENGDFMGNKRLVQIYTGWSNQEMKSLEDDPQGEEKVRAMVEKMKQELPFYPIYDLGELDKEEESYQRVVRMIRKLVEERNVRVVCIDNLNIFTDVSKTDQNQYKAQIITAFDAIAVELNISVIIVHHATDKDRVNEGLRLENFLDNKPMDVFIPHISKTLGTSAAISKTKVGMTMAYDSTTGTLYVWVQTNRDGPQDKRFFLFFNANNKRIYNTSKEILDLPVPTDNEVQVIEDDYFTDLSISNKPSLIPDIIEAQVSDNQNIAESTNQKANSPTVLFGNQAIMILRRKNILGARDTSCPKPFQTEKGVKQLTIQSEDGGYQRVPKKDVKCGGALFYTVNGSDEILCLSCSPIDNKSTIFIWYQTTPRKNKDEWYWLTYAERAYWDSKKDNPAMAKV